MIMQRKVVQSNNELQCIRVTISTSAGQLVYSSSNHNLKYCKKTKTQGFMWLFLKW